MTVKKIYFLDKIYLLVWKNLHGAFHNRWLMLTIILTPGIFAMILVFMRFYATVNYVDFAQFNNISPEIHWNRAMEELVQNHKKVAKHGLIMKNCFLPQPIVAYAPDNMLYKTLMTMASSEYLNNIKLHGFNSVAEMRNAIAKEHYFAGIGFKDILSMDTERQLSRRVANEYEVDLDFSIVFPSELRFFNTTFIGESWMTTEKHNHIFLSSGEVDTFDVYVREGFISLQHGVSMAFIKIVAEVSNSTQIVLKRFPRIEHKYDTIVNTLIHIMSLVILIGSFYPCTHLVKHIISEKENNLKRYMNTIGIGETINFLSWFIIAFITLIVSSIPVLCILKIKWIEGFSVLQYSSWSTLYFFLLCCNIASVTFCYLISSPLSLTSTGVVMLTFLWFLTYLPFTASLPLKEQGLMIRILSIIFPNTGMSMGFREILIYEENGEGLHWKNMFQKAGPCSVWSVGSQSCFLIIMSIIYAIIGINVESIIEYCRFSTKQLCSCSYFSRNSGTTGMRASVRYLFSVRKSKIYAVENDIRRATIELQKLTYIIDRKPIIHDISMSIYEGEITIFMGHNGAGKTSLLLLIADFLRPTSGKILFHGVRLQNHSRYALNIGACFEQINFPHLTVANNIIFYCHLKGLKTDAAQLELKKYLTAMNLSSFSNILACNLSHGLKQSLSICCALCGGSRYVILDEPSADMDAVARKRLWQLLMNEKDNRVILIATNSTEEAEVLGDRLAILSGGLLMCFGTQFFLKTLFGRGYRLVCLKSPDCNTEVVTEFIKNQIPNVTLESEIGVELSYRLSEGYAAVLPKLLADLEESFLELGINSCSISEPSVEDICLHMGAEDPSEDNRIRHSEIMIGHTIYTEEYEKLSEISHYESYKGLKLTLSHVSYMFWKRFTHSKRRKAILLQFTMPAIFTLATYLLANTRSIRRSLRPITFTIKAFQESITAVSNGLKLRNPRDILSAVQTSRFNQLRNYFETLPFLSAVHKIFFLEGRDFSDYALDKQAEMGLAFNKKHIIGFSYEEHVGGECKITAWFNNYYLHSAPLSLNIAHNALLASRSYNGRITVTNDPLPFSLTVDPNEANISSYAGNYLPINLTFVILIVYSSVMLYLVHERTSRFKLLQKIYGAKDFPFWLGSALYDTFRIAIISLSAFLIIIAFEHSSWEQFFTAISHFFILFFFGVCMTPFYYLFSLFFKDNLAGFIFIVTLNIFGVAAFCTVVESFAHANLKLPIGYQILSYLVPYYSLSSCLTKIFSIERLEHICSIDEIKNISLLVDECETVPNCCVEPRRFAWEHLGILPEITFFFIIWFLCTMLLIAHSYRKSIAKLFSITNPADNAKLAFQDYRLRHESSETFFKDVVNESYRIDRLKTIEYREKPLVVSNLSYVHGNKVQIHRTSLLLERCECFGLLGANGAGKSLFVKMLVGDERLSSGRVHVDGNSLTDDIVLMYKHIGYCPYTISFPHYMTCRELLVFFCRLRGIRKQYIEDLTSCLTTVLGIVKYSNKKMLHVSAGIKRRLGTAIALIGNPSIVYLDGLSTNIDPAGRRQVWNIICRMCAQGKTVLFTSHDVFDCQRFCTRFGIMHNGRLVCVNSISNLKELYTPGYVLQVQIKPLSKSKRPQTTHSLQASSSLSLLNPFMKIMSFVENEFPNSTVRDQSGAIVIFFIPLGEVSLSMIYKKIQRNTFLLNVENFRITRETLPMIFADIVERRSKSSSIISEYSRLGSINR